MERVSWLHPFSQTILPMKHIPLLLLTTLLSFYVDAQPHVALSIKSATVFLNGAELSSTAKVSLPQGESEVLFTNVAGGVNAQSLTIGAESGVVVQSATFQNNYLGDTALSPRARSLRDSISFLEKEEALVEDKKAVIEEQLSTLKENKKVAGQNNGLNVAELSKMLDLLSTKMTALLAAQRELDNRSEVRTARIALLHSQMEEEQKKGYTPGGQLLVKFYAPSATSSAINLSYVVPNAGWTPSYDLRVEKVGDPVKLFYKASVYQNSGVKWEGVRLTLSTGNPNEGAEAPVMNPRYLSFYQPYTRLSGDQMAGAGRANSINMSRTQDAMTAQPFKGNNYETYKRDSNDESLKVAQMPTTISNYVQVDNSGIATTFDIDLPYTIPTDGQQHTVAIKTYELPATYRYFSVPRLDRDAFLQAQITDWENLNLLPAVTNIFFEGAYVGQGSIDMRNIRDTMNLSLGRDKKIVIRRERDKSLHSEKFFGSNEKQRFDFTISIRNTRKESVHLVLLDQIPVSNEGDISVEDFMADSADYTKETGALKWTLDVKPQETRKLKLGYTVKYPKGKTLSGL